MAVRTEILTYYTKEREMKKARQRFLMLRALLLEERNSELLEMLEAVLEQCRRYVESVIKMEARAAEIKKKYGNDPVAWRLEIEPVDEARRLSHNSLIAHLEAFNRNCTKKYGWQPKGRIPVGGVFTLDPNVLSDPYSLVSRTEIANWAFYLVLGMGTA